MNRSIPHSAAYPGQLSRTWGNWWVTYRWPILVVSFFGLLLGGAIYLQSTLVVGTELNAGNWQLRQFSFRRDPFTGSQLTGIKHESPPLYHVWTTGTTGATIAPAIAGYLTTGASAAERWDLVSVNDATPSTMGRASILVELIDVRDAKGKDFWVDWTNDHPTRAKRFWPAVHHLVAADAYAKLPKLFELAVSERDEDVFAEALYAYMLAELTDHAQLLMENGRSEAASSAARIGLTYGDSDELQQLVTP